MKNNRGNAELIGLVIVGALLLSPILLLIYVGSQMDKTADQRMEKCLKTSASYKDCYDLIIK